MLVRNWMSTDVITVDAEDSMATASKLMREYDIRGLPVMKKGKLAGVVTDRDMKKASASDASTLDIHELLYLLTKIKMKDIMHKSPVAIPMDDTVEEAALVLLDNKLSGAPVLDADGKLVGVITQSDIFRVLVSLSGVREKGVQLGFLLEDRPGSIKEVADVLRDYGCRVVSILSSSNVQQGQRHVYIRACECDRERMKDITAALRAKSKLLYMVDHRKEEKEVYQEYQRPPAGWTKR